MFDNRFVKVEGVWRIYEMRVYPVMNTDYYQGWAKSKLAVSAPTMGHMPTHPTPAADVAEGVVPAFFAVNPATGKRVAYPAGTHAVANDLLLPAIAKAPDYPVLTIAEANHQLDIAKAYDATVNVSNGFANYIDDLRGDLIAKSFASTGMREKVDLGFYIGPERILKAELLKVGQTRRRTSIPIHLRLQPVVFVAPDAKSTTLRTRLFSMSTSLSHAGTFGSGMYPNDGAVLENGVSAAPARASTSPIGNRMAGQTAGLAPRIRTSRSPSRGPVLKECRLTSLRTWAFVNMALRRARNRSSSQYKPSARWFSYKNPVSGRTPQYYCPDERTCYKDPSMSSPNEAVAIQ